MYTIHNRDDLEKLKKLNQINHQLKEQRLKKKLGRQDFHYNIKEVFEPVTKKQTEIKESINEQTNQIEEGQKQSIVDSQKITDAINRNTLSAQTSSKNLSQSIYQGIKNYDEISKQSNQIIIDLIQQNKISSDIAHTLSALFKNNNPQFKIQFNEDNESRDIYKFTINENFKLPIQIKGNNIIFQNNKEYNLTNPSLEHFLNTTNIKREQIEDPQLIKDFLDDIKYKEEYNNDKKSERYRLINHLLKFPIYKSEEETSASGLKEQIIVLPADPNELVNKLRILNQEKIAGNDSKLINTHIEAIVDQLLNLQVINNEEHYNILNFN